MTPDRRAASKTGAVVRVDRVTRRFMETVGQSVDGWLANLERRDVRGPGRGGRTWTQRGAGAPCDEIPCLTPSAIDLLSYRLVDRGRIDAHAAAGVDLPSMRILGGRLHLGRGVRFQADGNVAPGEGPTLHVPGRHPATILLALVGRPAIDVCDEPMLEGVTVTGVAGTERDATFTLDVPWDAVDTAWAPDGVVTR